MPFKRPRPIYYHTNIFIMSHHPAGSSGSESLPSIWLKNGHIETDLSTAFYKYQYG